MSGYNQSFNPNAGGYSFGNQGAGGGAGAGGGLTRGSFKGGNEMDEPARLRHEFQQLDTNGDGMVDRDEMDAFLARQGIDDEHRNQIIDELFDKLDKDANGRIELNEFSEQYVQTKNQLIEREDEIKRTILTNN